MPIGGILLGGIAKLDTAAAVSISRTAKGGRHGRSSRSSGHPPIEMVADASMGAGVEEPGFLGSNTACHPTLAEWRKSHCSRWESTE